MRVLFTTWTLAGRSGAELFVRDLAGTVRRRGHEVCILTPFPGPLAASIAASGIHVATKAADIHFEPDVIHAQHAPTLLRALLAFPATPAISVVHDAEIRFDEPLAFDSIVRHVAVDERCRARILRNAAIPAPNVEVILNFADTTRFQARTAPAAAKPRRALVFSNYARQGARLDAIVAACRNRGIAVDVVGDGVDRPTLEPETILHRYDLVFAKARCAIEAMATGNAVILCDFAGLGPMVTTENMHRLRRLNFGAGALTMPVSAARIEAELARYDPSDTAKVSAFIRENASLDSAADEWIALYERVRGSRLSPNPAERRAIAALAHRWRWTYRAKHLLRAADATPVGASLHKSLRPYWRRAFARPPVLF